jgi:hypothetical protein
VRKLKIPDNFIGTTSTGYLHYDFGKTTLLVARTRNGKTSFSFEFTSLFKHLESNAICILFGPDLGSYPDDLLDKQEYYESVQQFDTGLAVWKNKDHKVEFMAQIAGLSNKNTILCTNSNYLHVNAIVGYIKQVKDRPIYVVIDEAHKDGLKSYKFLKNELRGVPNIAVFETTATYRTNLLAEFPPDFIQAIIAHGTYTDPLSATIIPFLHNNWTKDNDRLHPEQIQAIKQDLDNEKSLVLINGYELVSQHKTFKTQLKTTISRDDVAIITLNSGSVTWTRATQDTDYEQKLVHPNGKPIRAASSAVAAIVNQGFNHIIVIGQKQVSEGQTIGCKELTLTLQVIGTAKKDSTADSLAQTIRTGGMNILNAQKVMMDPDKWEGIKKHVEANENLRDALSQATTPEEYQQIVADSYYEIKKLKINHGAYKPVKKAAIADGVGSYYWEIPVDKFAHLFAYGATATGKLYSHVRDSARKQAWYKNESLAARKISGDIFDKLEGRGNDVQAFVHCDPSSKHTTEYPLTFWLRDNKICCRYIFKHEPCLIHNYYGELSNFSKSAQTVLQLKKEANYYTQVDENEIIYSST